MTLTEFLVARIAEDEERARRVGTVEHPLSQAEYFRVLAECEAKLRIVEKVQRADAAFDQQIDPATSAASFALTEVLHLLAIPYADHPDYHDEWRVEVASD